MYWNDIDRNKHRKRPENQSLMYFELVIFTMKEHGSVLFEINQQIGDNCAFQALTWILRTPLVP